MIHFLSLHFFILQLKQIFLSLKLRCCIRQNLYSFLPSFIARMILFSGNQTFLRKRFKINFFKIVQLSMFMFIRD